MEIGKIIEINGYDYQYVGKKVGSSGEIRGQRMLYLRFIKS